MAKIMVVRKSSRMGLAEKSAWKIPPTPFAKGGQGGILAKALAKAAASGKRAQRLRKALPFEKGLP
jgi:hypothetical protein